jgi:hypothetical protein
MSRIEITRTVEGIRIERRNERTDTLVKRHYIGYTMKEARKDFAQVWRESK